LRSSQDKPKERIEKDEPKKEQKEKVELLRSSQEKFKPKTTENIESTKKETVKSSEETPKKTTKGESENVESKSKEKPIEQKSKEPVSEPVETEKTEVSAQKERAISNTKGESNTVKEPEEKKISPIQKKEPVEDPKKVSDSSGDKPELIPVREKRNLFRGEMKEEAKQKRASVTLQQIGSLRDRKNMFLNNSQNTPNESANKVGPKKLGNATAFLTASTDSANAKEKVEPKKLENPTFLNETSSPNKKEIEIKKIEVTPFDRRKTVADSTEAKIDSPTRERKKSADAESITPEKPVTTKNRRGTWSSSKFKNFVYEDDPEEEEKTTPVSSPSEKQKCAACNKTVYLTERIATDTEVFHKMCFKCCHCSQVIKLGNYASLEGKYYCKPHFKQLFAKKGNYHEGFGEEKQQVQWERERSKSNADTLASLASIDLEEKSDEQLIS